MTRTIRSTRHLAPIFTLLLFALFGCATGPGVPAGNPGEVLKSDLQRAAAPSVPGADTLELVQGNSDFAFDLYQKVKGEEGNLFYSPFSISIALAMTYGGAKGRTAQQMADTLHFTLPRERLHPAFNGLDQALASRGRNARAADGEPFRLKVVNALWGQKDHPFLDSFLDLLALNYGAGMTLLDFVTDPEACRLRINQWVEEQTEGRIKDLIPQGNISAATRLVLTNAIYFNAAWKKPFEKANTLDRPFNRIDDSPVTVPTMNQTEYFGYVRQDGYQAVELPYDGNELSMVVVMPDQGQFGAFEGNFNAARAKAIVDGLQPANLALSLPKFSFTSKFTLAKQFKELGMKDAFTFGLADFSGMDGSHNLFISAIIHKAFVSVSEEGTEAAAATAVIMDFETSVPPTPKVVAFDRPFFFFIRDLQTGAILFIGRVLDPSA